MEMKHIYESLKDYAIHHGNETYYPKDVVYAAINELIAINHRQGGVISSLKDLFSRFTYNTTLRRIQYVRNPPHHKMFSPDCIPFFKRDGYKIFKQLEDDKHGK